LRALSGGRVFRPSLNIIRVVDSVIQVATMSSGEKIQFSEKLEEFGWMGQKKRSLMAESAVKTRSGEEWFVKNVSSRGWLIFLANVSLLSKRGSEGLPRQGFGGLIDVADK